ncbi:hypothetical protein AAG570_007849 [Ranatra chinensis]|uniref:Natural killer cell triggering receptor n=1 Tax=Ranatra chinensis TaxID=642074 RepID=A0ABD0XT07_9HEMI
MASKRRNMFHKNKTQETTEKGRYLGESDSDSFKEERSANKRKFDSGCTSCSERQVKKKKKKKSQRSNDLESSSAVAVGLSDGDICEVSGETPCVGSDVSCPSGYDLAKEVTETEKMYVSSAGMENLVKRRKKKKNGSKKADSYQDQCENVLSTNSEPNCGMVMNAEEDSSFLRHAHLEKESKKVYDSSASKVNFVKRRKKKKSESKKAYSHQDQCENVPSTSLEPNCDMTIDAEEDSSFPCHVHLEQESEKVYDLSAGKENFVKRRKKKKNESKKADSHQDQCENVPSTSLEPNCDMTIDAEEDSSFPCHAHLEQESEKVYDSSAGKENFVKRRKKKKNESKKADSHQDQCENVPSTSLEPNCDMTIDAEEDSSFPCHAHLEQESEKVYNSAAGKENFVKRRKKKKSESKEAHSHQVLHEYVPSTTTSESNCNIAINAKEDPSFPCHAHLEKDHHLWQVSEDEKRRVKQPPEVVKT